MTASPEATTATPTIIAMKRFDLFCINCYKIIKKLTPHHCGITECTNDKRTDTKNGDGLRNV
jgi:hypothetical protein